MVALDRFNCNWRNGFKILSLQIWENRLMHYLMDLHQLISFMGYTFLTEIFNLFFFVQQTVAIQNRILIYHAISFCDYHVRKEFYLGEGLSKHFVWIVFL